MAFSNRQKIVKCSCEESSCWKIQKGAFNKDAEKICFYLSFGQVQRFCAESLSPGKQARCSTGLGGLGHSQGPLNLNGGWRSWVHCTIIWDPQEVALKGREVGHCHLTSGTSTAPSQRKDGSGTDGHYAVDLSLVACQQGFTKLLARRKY